MTTAPDPYMAVHVADDPLLRENVFRGRDADATTPPTWTAAKALLPRPHWPARPDALACYWRTWEMYWANLRAVAPGSGFIAPFIDTAFNGCLFLWDSVFILRYARYAARAFDVFRTLDNFYAKQHVDGFICREIDWVTGQDKFHRHDPVSTGPNLLAWSEWDHWLDTGDRARLAAVFAPVLSYHRWLRRYRTWPDGTSWSSGWGCGMDNQPRVGADSHPAFHHGWLGWIDATAHALLSARRLVDIARVLGREADVADLTAEIPRLAAAIDATMWNERLGSYVDRRHDGSPSDVLTIGAYWTLLAGAVPAERRARMLALLRDERHYARPHRLPSLAASHPEYQPSGDYWRGAVWAPTTSMVLAALRGVGEDQLAHEIGRNHLDNVVRVFTDTGTVWENYAPESAAPGKPAKPDFTGWSGIGPIAVLFEEVFGLRADAPAKRLVWDLRLTDEHGVAALPIGTAATVDLHVAARSSPDEAPLITASASSPLIIEVRWAGGRREISVG